MGGEERRCDGVVGGGGEVRLGWKHGARAEEG